MMAAQLIHQDPMPPSIVVSSAQYKLDHGREFKGRCYALLEGEHFGA